MSPFKSASLVFASSLDNITPHQDRLHNLEITALNHALLLIESRPILIFASTDEQHLLKNIRIIGRKAPNSTDSGRTRANIGDRRASIYRRTILRHPRWRTLMELLFGQMDTNQLTQLPTYLTWYQCGDRKAHRVSRNLSCWQKGTHYSAEALSV